MVAIHSRSNGYNTKTGWHYLFHIFHQPSPRERLSQDSRIQEVGPISCAAIFGLRQNLPRLSFFCLELSQFCLCHPYLCPLSLSVQIVTDRDVDHERRYQDGQSECRTPVPIEEAFVLIRT